MIYYNILFKNIYVIGGCNTTRNSQEGNNNDNNNKGWQVNDI